METEQIQWGLWLIMAFAPCRILLAMGSLFVCCEKDIIFVRGWMGCECFIPSYFLALLDKGPLSDLTASLKC